MSAVVQLVAVDGEHLPEGVEPCSDLANAYRLHSQHGRDLRFCGSLGWLAWDGIRWRPDEDGEVMRRAHDVVRSLRIEAADLLARAERSKDEERIARAKRLYSWAVASQSGTRLKQLVATAEVLEGIATRPDAFDQHPDLFVAANGTVDLATGKLRPHQREDLLTRRSPVNFDPAATSPVFASFLDRIFAGNAELIAFLQRFAGYSLTGSTAEQCFAILHGSGANGKSTLLEVLRYVLGDYAANAAADTLMASKNGRGTDNDVARLRGARFVSASESGEARQLDEERVKRLSGDDTLTARFLFKEHFEFRPSFKLWLATNHRPRIKGTDTAIWRRVMLVPFEVTIPPEERDHELGAKLRAEAPGILRWAVEGEVMRRRDGLRPSPEVLEATAAYRSDEDVVGRFLADECVVLPAASVKAGSLYQRFGEWCRENGEELMSQTALGRRLDGDERFQRDRTKKARIWRGLGLLARDDDEGDG